MNAKKYDSLIFDMDGTLWDAIDSYAAVWNRTNAAFGITRQVARKDLLDYMGQTIDVIFSGLYADTHGIDTDSYLSRLDHWETTLMPELGGRPYPGVIEGLRALSKDYKLFLVSNCGSEGLRNMMRFIGITDLITDTLTYGETGQSKDCNIATIIRRHDLRSPLYIGDTQGDSNAAHAAGADMAFARWGFGSCTDAELQFDSFPQLTQTLLNNARDAESHTTL
ncbi:MAG: HAD family hydrolase [Muribaculaceae bacterium]|nr:HAD family hydrolase [Muribaculaceae bacterium]